MTAARPDPLAAVQSRGTVAAVLNGLIDYAGLFPPAAHDMARTVANYAAYQRRPDAWALGRLVVPATRLAEFDRALDALPEVERLGTRWPITTLLGADVESEVRAVVEFRERHVHGGPRVLSFETRADSEQRVRDIVEELPAGSEVFFELEPGPDLEAHIASVQAAGAYAKIRMGGVKPSDIPEPERVLRFLEFAARARVPFKATAGLHHPVRGLKPLTYEEGSPRATMYGYLNLVLAAAVLWQGSNRGIALDLLTAEDRGSLVLGEEEIAWAGTRISRHAVAGARGEFVLAIGSCSFTEPLDEIREDIRQ